MRIWACLELRALGPLGLPSRAGEMLAGRTALERTVLRLARVPGLAGVAVLVEPGRAEAARQWLGSAPARVLEALGPDDPRREALRRARKWAKDSWRGGLAQAMDLDSYNHWSSLLAAARELKADAVLTALPEGALVDPDIMAGIIRHAAPEGVPVLATAMCQAPAGFAGLLALAAWLEPAAKSGLVYGRTMAWSPERASFDPGHRGENYLAPVAVRRCEFRGAADSARSAELIAELLRRAPGPDGLGPSAEEAAALVRADPALYAGRLPRIVEVELTTAGRVDFADGPLARDLPARRMDRELFGKLLADLAAYDDVLMTVGGAGDPLAHPEVFDLLKLARERGVYGLHLETPGPLLDEAAARKLLDLDLDVISVRLGAATAETYRKLTGRGDFELVCANIERLAELRRASGREWPCVAVEAEKRVEVEPELLDFFDRWTQKADWPVIRPASDWAGRFPDRAAVHLNLAERLPCRRLMKELVVLADGTVPVCRLDYAPAEPAGDLRRQSLGELWTSGRIAALRAEQHARKFDGFPLCPRCRDWDGV